MEQELGIPLRLMAVLAHPDDESLGIGGTLAKYAAQGARITLACATRGERGWFGVPAAHPGSRALGELRQAELLRAAAHLGIQQVYFLDLVDGEMRHSDLAPAAGRLAHLLRRERPQVVISFGPDGDYGHPDHIATAQLTQAALLRAASDWELEAGEAPHTVDKLYAFTNSPQMQAVVQELVGGIGIEVDGVQRSLFAWPEWAITTRLALDAADMQAARRAILEHRTQLPSLGDAAGMSEAQWRQVLVEQNAYYRVFSLVPGGPGVETDLFQGLR